MAAIVKDAGEIWTRLLDHRPFLNGEIKYFVKEFEERRGEREVTRLFSVLERVTDICDAQLERARLASDAHLPVIDANLEVAVSMCARILDKEQQHASADPLVSRRELRKAEWHHFITDMTDKCSAVDTTFEEKQAQLSAFYADLEHKLHLQ
ncbi:biogenesis of lysosome-related organelles complex 1 subunit 5 isoform X3 [Bacillus rossius redtenbacheri]|uniref:biogenesis of lysosome-related organelles complex 1 subunit 5 isoform X3 n=1 Tax=Bacillus rossius redtenbacheri TaxID=93214 RepID=UPI002FDD2CA6